MMETSAENDTRSDGDISRWERGNLEYCKHVFVAQKAMRCTVSLWTIKNVFRFVHFTYYYCDCHYYYCAGRTFNNCTDNVFPSGMSIEEANLLAITKINPPYLFRPIQWLYLSISVPVRFYMALSVGRIVSRQNWKSSIKRRTYI